MTVSLAGSLFFTVPSGDARPRVLAYLALTMAPFAVIAPLLGPVLDRTRGGRRLVVFSAALGRAVLCWLMARHVDGLLLYPEAFGVLVLAKSHSIAKSSLVPAVVEHDDELVRANSNLALISVVAGFVGGLPAAAILKLFGARWSLLLGTMVFLAAAFLALQIPRAARVGRGETPAEREEMQTASIVLAGTAMALLRGGVGFLTFLAAFLLKDAGEAAWVYGAVLATSAIGGSSASWSPHPCAAACARR
ncbi:MAG: hypothetical protein M5U14_14240 [Acidimicrobiia bacterium]|nr:hypothetical protein [Acidimicrobiia bacterium]